MKKLAHDMTVGSPLTHIIKFSIPLIIGNLFQQAYTIIDSIIVGRGVGILALASIGNVDWLTWLFLSSTIGLTSGFGVAFAKSFGEKNYKDLRCNIASSFILSVLIGILLVFIAEYFAYDLLRILNTPSDIINMSLEYIRYLFLGIFVSMIYNYLSSILRAIGNSKAPLQSIVIAFIINVILDLLFIFIFKLGLKGAAIATIIAQIFSALYCFKVLNSIDFLRLDKSDFIYSLNRYLYLLKLGLPISFMNSFIGISGIIVQSVVNRYGIDFVTGVTITNKLYALFEVGGVSIGVATLNYVAQNYGAKLKNRIYSGLKYSLFLSVSISFIISFLLIVFGKNIIYLFMNTKNSSVVKVAYDYLFIMCSFLWLLYSLHILRSTLQGLSNSYIPFLSSIAELFARVFMVLIASNYLGYNSVFYCEIAAWLTSVCILFIGVFYSFKKLNF